MNEKLRKVKLKLEEFLGGNTDTFVINYDSSCNDATFDITLTVSESSWGHTRKDGIDIQYQGYKIVMSLIPRDSNLVRDLLAVLDDDFRFDHQWLFCDKVVDYIRCTEESCAIAVVQYLKLYDEFFVDMDV